MKFLLPTPNQYPSSIQLGFRFRIRQNLRVLRLFSLLAVLFGLRLRVVEHLKIGVLVTRFGFEGEGGGHDGGSVEAVEGVDVLARTMPATRLLKLHPIIRLLTRRLLLFSLLLKHRVPVYRGIVVVFSGAVAVYFGNLAAIMIRRAAIIIYLKVLEPLSRGIYSSPTALLINIVNLIQVPTLTLHLLPIPFRFTLGALGDDLRGDGCGWLNVGVEGEHGAILLQQMRQHFSRLILLFLLNLLAFVL